MNKNHSKNLAIEAFLWLSNDDEKVSNFLGATGASAQDLRSSAQDLEFLGFILDFILSSDEYVMECANALKIAPEDIYSTRQNLPGGATPEWT